VGKIPGTSTTIQAIRIRRQKDKPKMMKNLTRAILGLILTAAATWLATRIVDQIFGPDEPALN